MSAEKLYSFTHESPVEEADLRLAAEWFKQTDRFFSYSFLISYFASYPQGWSCARAMFSDGRESELVGLQAWTPYSPHPKLLMGGFLIVNPAWRGKGVWKFLQNISNHGDIWLSERGFQTQGWSEPRLDDIHNRFRPLKSWSVRRVYLHAEKLLEVLLRLEQPQSSFEITQISKDSRTNIINLPVDLFEYDERLVTYDRQAFIGNWVNVGDGEIASTVHIARNGGDIVGYTILKAGDENSWVLAPLYADSFSIAIGLLTTALKNLLSMFLNPSKPLVILWNLPNLPHVENIHSVFDANGEGLIVHERPTIVGSYGERIYDVSDRQKVFSILSTSQQLA